MKALLGLPRLPKAAARRALISFATLDSNGERPQVPTVSATDERDAVSAVESLIRTSGATLPPLAPVLSGPTALRIGRLQDLVRQAAYGQGHLGVSFDQEVTRAMREAFDGLSLSEAGHDEVWHFLAAYVLPDVLLRRWPWREEGVEVVINESRLLGERRHALKDAFRRSVWIEPKFDGVVGARVWEDIRGRPSLFGDPRALSIYLHHVTHAPGERGDITDLLREGAKRLFRSAALVATPLMSDIEYASLIAASFEEARGMARRPAAPEQHPPLVDFAYGAAQIGIDIEPALRFEPPSAEAVGELRRSIGAYAQSLAAEQAYSIAKRYTRLLDRWTDFDPDLRRVLIAGVLHFLLEDDGNPDGGPAGLADDESLALLTEAVVERHSPSGT